MKRRSNSSPITTRYIYAVVVSEVGNKKLDSEEIFEEIISLLHSYSMKLYSKRHYDKKKIEIGTDNGSIRHEIELKDDKEIVHSIIPLVDKNDMKEI